MSCPSLSASPQLTTDSIFLFFKSSLIIFNWFLTPESFFTLYSNVSGTNGLVISFHLIFSKPSYSFISFKPKRWPKAQVTIYLSLSMYPSFQSLTFNAPATFLARLGFSHIINFIYPPILLKELTYIWHLIF